ncbi:MAG: sugar phosphate isomerase/epimerase [Candidatus Omnitrophica bacterium]|nr:sugar phosphate isomerase/epimerase [Candidatus Omnitrophota bacterium]
MARIPVGIQLYTVRDDLAKDYVGTIREVADMGYEGIELAGFGEISSAEMKSLLDDLGIQVAGCHAPLDQLKSDLDRVLDYQEVIGNHRIVLPWLPEDIQKKGSAGYREVGEFLAEVSEKISPRGFSISYHNHSFEFVPSEEGYCLDTLLKAGEKADVKSELDTYWVQHGGADPIEYIRRYAGRIELLHIKDMGPGADKPFAEVGSGILDWDSIFEAAESGGVEWYLVEPDLCEGPPLESAKKSLEFLKGRGMLG